MQIIIAILAFFVAQASLADELLKNKNLRSDDKRVAVHYGYRPSDLIIEHRNAVKRVDTDKISKDVMKRLERMDIDSYALVDEVTENLLRKADLILRAEGHDKLADDIADDFVAYYRNYNVRSYLGILEIGDHPPISEWLDGVHKKVHDALGDFLCQWSHVHDIYIINHANVVFNPKMAKDLKDYKDHFAGHLIWGWWWEHHGFAGVAAYWIVEGVCIAGSYGLGVITFVCSPIATYAEHIVDKHVAPPIAERIWDRVNE